MFQTPLLKVSPEALAAARERMARGNLRDILAHILGEDHRLDIQNVADSLDDAGCGFMVTSVFVKDSPVRSYKARVFEYVGTNAMNSQEAVHPFVEEAILRALIAFHEAALAKQQSVTMTLSRGLDE